MTKRQAIAAIQKAMDRANREVAGHASRGSQFARAMASEGYSGGYRDALQDVILVLHAGLNPNRGAYWLDWKRTKEEDHAV